MSYRVHNERANYRYAIATDREYVPNDLDMLYAKHHECECCGDWMRRGGICPRCAEHQLTDAEYARRIDCKSEVAS